MRTASHVASSRDDAAELRDLLGKARLEGGRLGRGHAEHDAAVAEQSIVPAKGASARSSFARGPCATTKTRSDARELGVLHDEVVVERREQALAQRRGNRERERGLVVARHDVEVGLDAALLLDEEPVRPLDPARASRARR